MALKIGLDIDGVIADSFPVFREELNKYYGKDIIKIDDCDISKVYNVDWADLDSFFDQNVEYLFSAPKVMDGALETINHWLKAGHEIIIVTARKKGLEEKITMEWLHKNNVPYNEVVFAGGASKTFAVKEHLIDVFVDDFISNALEIAALNIPVLLLDAPYNQGKLPEGVVRCYSWEDIKNQIEKRFSS